jgi:hypothetical protein
LMRARKPPPPFPTPAPHPLVLIQRVLSGSGYVGLQIRVDTISLTDE